MYLGNHIGRVFFQGHSASHSVPIESSKKNRTLEVEGRALWLATGHGDFRSKGAPAGAVATTLRGDRGRVRQLSG